MGKKTVAAVANKKGPTKQPARCGVHRKYKGIMPPRADCFVCKEIYHERNGGASDGPGQTVETDGTTDQKG